MKKERKKESKLALTFFFAQKHGDCSRKFRRHQESGHDSSVCGPNGFAAQDQSSKCRFPLSALQTSPYDDRKNTKISTTRTYYREILTVRALRSTVRSGAEERTFWGARLDVLIFRLRSYDVLISYTVECSGPKFQKILMFFGQAGMFLSFQARRSSAMRSSTSDLTVVVLLNITYYWVYVLLRNGKTGFE